MSPQAPYEPHESQSPHTPEAPQAPGVADVPLTRNDRIILQLEEIWRCLWGWLPGGVGSRVRGWLYGPLFASAGRFRSGVGVVVQGFRRIHMGRGVGLNRHASLYASRGTIRMGDNVFIGDFSSINANDAHIHIGSNVAIGPMCLIQGANHRFDRLDIPIVEQGHVPSFVRIEDDVWIGARCTILPGVTIHTGAVVGAGAVVGKDVPPYAVVVGVPAKVIRYRNQQA